MLTAAATTPSELRTNTELKFNMSGYPGGGYPRPGSGAPPGAYPGSAPSPGGYPGQNYNGGPARPPPPGQYGSAPPPNQAYGGAPPQNHGYGGARPPSQGYGGAPPPSQGYGGAPPPSQGYGGAPPPSQGYGGAPPPNQGYGGAPPANQFGGVDAKVQQWFNAVDQDRSGQIDFKELQRALVNGNWSNFSEEACRMMVDMFDRDKTGQINLQEFSSLFNYINQWKSLFESIDRDRSGFIEQAELTQAFNQMGYRFTPTFIQNVLSKYEPRTRRLTLDNFIVVCVQIKRLTDSFRTRDREMRGQAMLQYEDFIGLALGAHK